MNTAPELGIATWDLSGWYSGQYPHTTKCIDANKSQHRGGTRACARTHIGNRETRTGQEKRLEKLLRSCRAALDVSQSVKECTAHAWRDPHTHTHTHTHTICKQTDEQHNAGSECQFLVSWSSNKTKHVQHTQTHTHTHTQTHTHTHTQTHTDTHRHTHTHTHTHTMNADEQA